MKPQLPAFLRCTHVPIGTMVVSLALRKGKLNKTSKTNFSQNLKVSFCPQDLGLWDPFQTAGPAMAPIRGVPI